MAAFAEPVEASDEQFDDLLGRKMLVELDVMSRAVTARGKDGELEVKEPVRQVEGEVEILVPSAEERAADPTGWKTLERTVGIWDGEPGDPPDSEDPDHYIYK